MEWKCRTARDTEISRRGCGTGGSKGLFITTSSFSKDAIDFAKKQLQVKLILVDGKMLTNLMIQYNLGVSVVKTYEIKQLDVDYFEGEMI